MERQEMICATCIYYHEDKLECRRIPTYVSPVSPYQWCGEGAWYGLNRSTKEWEGPFYWGEWERSAPYSAGHAVIQADKGVD